MRVKFLTKIELNSLTLEELEKYMFIIGEKNIGENSYSDIFMIIRVMRYWI